MNYRLWRLVMWLFLTTGLVFFLPASMAISAEPGLPNPFFIFDNGLRGIADPPRVLKELGYAGMGTSGLNVADTVKRYREAGLKVLST